MSQAAWLLEWPGDDNMPARWWNPDTGWMIDPHKAIWFVRERDAASYKTSAKMHWAVPCEHLFGLSLDRCPIAAEQKAQAARCSCKGSDDYCPCQNVVQP